MRRTLQIAILTILIPVFGVGATEDGKGTFQINTVFMTASYPLFGNGGQDLLRHSSWGISLKSTRGEGFHGMIDLTLLFPYVYEEQSYPAETFSRRSMTLPPVVLDGVIGLAYAFDISPMILLISAGFHTGLIIEGPNTLAAFGLGLDLQNFVKLGRVLTAQIGVKLNVDFAGIQNFSSESNHFSGLPLAAGLYTGLGLRY